MHKPTYVDLFAGAGGLSEGFIRSGFLPIAHVEQDPSASLTLKTRLAYHHLKQSGRLSTYISYLRKEITREQLYEEVPKELLQSVINECITGRTLQDIFAKIDSLQEKKTVDVIIGGPPCQAYSTTGRVAHVRKTRWDSRKFLYKLYAQFLHKYKPKMFVFENVPGLLSSGQGKYLRQMQELFRKVGYTTDHKMLDAANFGVIQHRCRVILVGWRKNLKLSYPEFDQIENEWTIKDLFADLPPLKPAQRMEVAQYIGQPTPYLTHFEIRNGIPFTTQHITRPHNEKDRAIYKLAIEKWEKEGKILKNNQIPEEMRTQSNVSSFLDRFKVVRRNALSHTMIAHIAKDGHHFIHPDLKQLRSLSVREAARIQSFPDDYFFEGTRSHAFRQVGNAVPPLMSDTIARALKNVLTLNSRD